MADGKSQVVKLNLNDRLAMQFFMPEKGSIVTQTLVQSIMNKVAITAKEISDWNIVADGAALRWDPKKAEEIEVTLIDVEIEIIRQGLARLDKEGLVTQQLLPTCLKMQKL